MAVDNEDGVAVNGDCGLMILFHCGALNIHGAIQPKFSLCRESMLFKEVFIPAAVSFHSHCVISIKTLSTLDAWSHCDKRNMQSHLSKCWSRDMRIAN
jgi:hypothetical protein